MNNINNTSINNSSNSLELHVNKPGDLRHPLFSKGCSVSGQFTSSNFDNLVSFIRKIFPTGKICFLDTRDQTHFEVNRLPVTLITDNNANKTSEDINARESELVISLLGKKVLLRGNHLYQKPEETTVDESSTMQKFIEDSKYNESHIYKRFALDEHGPLTDDQVERYLSLLTESKQKNIWIHTNSVVGGASAMLLVVMKDILESAVNEPLDQILERYEKKGDFLKVPKPDDKNGAKKIKRAEFLRDFYDYAVKRMENSNLTWSNWKAR